MTKIKDCGLCQLPITNGHIVVHDPKGWSGIAHPACWRKAFEAAESTRIANLAHAAYARRLHQDAENVIGPQ